jgi:cell wall-associated NlpC family hydrolase
MGYRPLINGIRRHRRALKSAGVVCATLGVLTTTVPASGAPPAVADKQREASSILNEINSLDSNLNRAVESYNGARLHLAQTKQAIRTNIHVLKIADHNLRRSQSNIAKRLVALYTSDEGSSTIEVLLGARSLDDVIARLDAAQSVAAQDAAIARQAQTFRSVISRRQISLLRDRRRAITLVADTAARQHEIEASIGRRQQLLASVKGEIERMQAAEQQRQLQIAAQVRARLAEQAQAQAAAQTQAAAAAPPATDTVPAASAPSPPPPTIGPAAPTAGMPPTASAAPARYGGAVAIAMRYLGVPYKWGGASPATGFDCSGFTMYVYAQLGVSLPHYTGDQWQMGTAVARSDLQPGDLVFFDGLGHEGMYIGNNQFIHAPHTGDVVKISSITGSYAGSYMGARRL